MEGNIMSDITSSIGWQQAYKNKNKSIEFVEHSLISLARLCFELTELVTFYHICCEADLILIGI